MRVMEHPELNDYISLNDKYNKDFQHILGVCKWSIVAGRFDLAYNASSLSKLLAAPRVGHIDLAIMILGYLKEYPKRGYAINP